MNSWPTLISNFCTLGVQHSPPFRLSNLGVNSEHGNVGIDSGFIYGAPSILENLLDMARWVPLPQKWGWSVLSPIRVRADKAPVILMEYEKYEQRIWDISPSSIAQDDPPAKFYGSNEHDTPFVGRPIRLLSRLSPRVVREPQDLPGNFGVPLNHPFRQGFSIKKKPPLCSTLFYFGDSPIHGPPHMLLDFPAGRLQSRQLMCSAQVPSSPHSFCPPPSFRWGPNGWLQMIIEIHVEFHVEI